MCYVNTFSMTMCMVVTRACHTSRENNQNLSRVDELKIDWMSMSTIRTTCQRVLFAKNGRVHLAMSRRVRSVNWTRHPAQIRDVSGIVFTQSIRMRLVKMDGPHLSEKGETLTG